MRDILTHMQTKKANGRNHKYNTPYEGSSRVQYR